VANPEGPYVLGLRRGKDLVTLSVKGQVGEKLRTLTIASETLDLSALIADTVKALARELVVSFLVPLAEITPEELDTRIRAYLCDIEEEMYPQ